MMIKLPYMEPQSLGLKKGTGKEGWLISLGKVNRIGIHS